MKVVRLLDGHEVPALGQGTWRMGERGDRQAEIATLRAGVERGLAVIDTAEMYADGEAERIVAQAIHGLPREAVFLVSKVLPSNASAKALPKACEASLRRLGVDRIDLYLLHWPGRTPLAETVASFESLRAAGKIARWGVSNFGLADMQRLPVGCATNQLLYSLAHRGIEFDLLPWMGERGMPMMAYSPVGQGGSLLAHPALVGVAKARGATAAQIALCWSLRAAGVISIPKAASRSHLDENIEAASMTLTADECATLDAAFKPPKRATPLEIL